MSFQCNTSSLWSLVQPEKDAPSTVLRNVHSIFGSERLYHLCPQLHTVTVDIEAPVGDSICPAASTLNNYFFGRNLKFLYNFESRTILFSLFHLAPNYEMRVSGSKNRHKSV